MRNRKLLFSAVSSLVLSVVNMLIGLIIPRMMIGSFGSEVNGLIASITQFLSYITLLEAGIGGISRALLYKPLAERNLTATSGVLKSTRILYRRLAECYIVYSFGLSVLYPMIINRTFDLIFTGSLVIIISISSVAQYYYGALYSVLLTADQRRYITDTVQIISIVLSCLSTVLMIRIGASVHMVKLVSSLIFVLRPFMLKCYVARKYKLEKDAPPIGLPKEQKSAGIFHNVAWYVRSSTDIAILTLFDSLSGVSVYSIYRLVALSISNVIAGLFSGSEAMFGNVLAMESSKTVRHYFDMILFIVNTLSVILFSTALVLVIPFIKLYTISFTDANYVIPMLGYFLLISEMLNSLRKPYIDVITASGHFRQTQSSALIEAALNIILSLLLVKPYGATGISFATIIALFYRTIFAFVYCGKNIIHFSVLASLRRLVISLSQMAVIFFIFNVAFQMSIDSYAAWILLGLLSIITSSAVTVIINALFYWKETRIIYLHARKTILERLHHRGIP